tara:strand:- start:310 stop:756 length:447 start_codon:yes stop_codon:yes gene_type:complete
MAKLGVYKLKKYIVPCLLLAVSISTYGSRDYNLDNFPALKTNSFMWGQVTGCVYRFEKYNEFSSDNEEEEKAKKKLLDNILGDTREMLVGLQKIGLASGFIGEESFTVVQWESMIGNIALSEYETGTSWLQAVGCLKMLEDYRIFDSP